MKKVYSCAHCERSISELAYKMVLLNKPYLICKCKKQKVKNFK